MTNKKLDAELEAILERYLQGEQDSREAIAANVRAIREFEQGWVRTKRRVLEPTLKALAHKVAFALETLLDPEGQPDPAAQTHCTGICLYAADWSPHREPLDERTRERPFDHDYLAFEPDVHSRKVRVRWNTLPDVGARFRDAEEIGWHDPAEVTSALVQQYFNRFVDRILNQV